jgi:hypothetical protein
VNEVGVPLTTLTGTGGRIFAEETEHMRGRAVFTSFYEQLKSIRTFHRKYPNSVVSHEPNLDEALHPNVQVRGRGGWLLVAWSWS